MLRAFFFARFARRARRGGAARSSYVADTASNRLDMIPRANTRTSSAGEGTVVTTRKGPLARAFLSQRSIIACCAGW